MKVQEIVTNKVIEALNSGKVPWVQGWNLAHAFNAVSGRKYTGINSILLDNSPLGYITFKKLNELGGTLAKGSKGSIVTLWTFIENKKAEKVNGEFPKFPLLRYYNVFKVEDVSGLPEKFYVKTEREFRTLSEFQNILTTHNVNLTHGGNDAFYSPANDSITMPNKGQFKSEQEYHKVLAHELIHWTAKRVGREKDSYALEELVAEIGACMLVGEFGIDLNIENTVAYCQHWGNKIKADEWLVVKAAGRASKAVAYLLGEENVYQNEHGVEHDQQD